MISLIAVAALAAALAEAPVPPPDTLAPRRSVRGQAVDAASGEPVAGARVAVEGRKHGTTADREGRFVLESLPRRLFVEVTAAGFRKFSARLALGEGETELRVPLERVPPRLAESVTVEATPPAAADEPPSSLSRRYAGELVRELGSIVASDPLRSVQALPGVAANDELNAGFAARGLGFSSVGLYVDGVRLRAPFHTVRDVNDGYTLTIFNGDVVDSVTLLPGAAPARYGDHTGATLAVRTREGRADGVHVRASVGAAGAFATAEGPAGAKASWLVSGRRSFLGYIIDRVEDRPSLALGYRDLTARLTAHPKASQAVSVLGLFGRSRYENTEPSPDAHDMESAEAGTGLVNVSFRSSSGGGTLGASAFLVRETGDNRDTDGFPRFRSEAVTGGLQADASRLSGPWRVDGGIEARRTREDVLSKRSGSSVQSEAVREDYNESGWLLGGFAQATWTRAGAGLVLAAGARVDSFSPTAETVVSPRASVEVGLGGRTRLVAAVGAYRQFPELERLYGEHGNPELDAERSRQLSVALERPIAGPLRLRLEAYAQRESRLVFSARTEYRVERGVVLAPEDDARLENALFGPSRGLEVTLGAGGAGRLAGFLAYALAKACREDGTLAFDADFDQRHTVTAFVRTRVGTGGALSTVFRYGSAFPFAGFVEKRGGLFYVSDERNGLRPPAYARWDLRAQKRWTRGRASLELYLEVANVLGRENVRYNEIGSVDGQTGRTRMDQDTLLPRLPLFGATVEF